MTDMVLFVQISLDMSRGLVKLKAVNGSSFTSGYSSSELDADSGDVMYIENRAPITRATDQTENVKLIIEF